MVDDRQLDLRVAERLAEVRSRIAAAGGSTDVTVLAVTKRFGIDAALAAHRAGCSAIGENYAQETVAKLGDRDVPFAVHFIGQLQTNKVRLLAGLVDVYETVDRPALITALAQRAPGSRVLVQVDPAAEPTSGAAGKGGCPPAEVAGLVELATDAGLHVDGLMTVGPTRGGPEAARAGFRAVRSLVDALGLQVCSMGMSDDVEVAVQEGSTEVRIGSALFGPRPR